MGIVEFVVRILDNLAWIIGANGPLDIVQAIINIMELVTENFSLFT